MDSFSKRQAELSAWWHFVCQCERCAMEQQHPELPAREEQLEAECAQLETIFKQQLKSAHESLAAQIAELQKFASRMQSLVDEHERFASTLSSPSSSLIQSKSPVLIPLLPQLRRLCDVLESLLALLPPGDALLPLSLEQHRRVCVKRTLIAARWGGCKYPDYQVGIFRLLAMQVRYPEHATLTPQKQVTAMGAYIRQYMQSNGDASPEQLEMEHGEEIDRRGLRPLFDECCTAIARERSRSSS
jgi:hypothetical protein